VAIDAQGALPVSWAFVVQFRPGTLIEEGRMAGRVEHVASGRTGHFETLPELLGFIAAVLGGVREGGAG
jgi:hypothetical protein